MTKRPLLTVAATGCMALAWAAAPPTPAVLQQWAGAFVRPALLPFTWTALGEAQRSGDDAEYFARARQLLDLMPTWTDGHAVFAYRLALDTHTAVVGDAGEHAWRRLQVALLWLESARPDAGRREVELLQTMAFLPEVAAQLQPRLAERLRPNGGATALADHYLAEAERIGGGARVFEHRTFLAPKLAAGLLDAGQPAQARSVLATAISRSAAVGDRALATEWASRLDEVVRWLDGDRSVDLAAVHDDPRLAPLWPHLR